MIGLQGISQKIDSCSGLIAQKALRTYRHLPVEHKRWIDPEDLLQEGLMAAYLTELQHDDKDKAKYSTYLYRALDWTNSKLQTGVRTRKRDSPGLVELDRPVEGDEGHRRIDVLDPKAMIQGREMDMVNAFMTVFRAVGQKAKVTMIRAFAAHDTRTLTPEIAEELRRACVQHHVGFEDLWQIRGNERIIGRLLTMAAHDGTLDLDATEDLLRVLSCVGCTNKFSLGHVREGRFFVSTMTCRGCYKRLARQRHSCFGKGYSEKLAECTMHCQDRGLCKQYIQIGRKENMTSDLLEGVDLSAAEKVAKEKKVKKTKTTTATKPKKTAKAEAEPVAKKKAKAKTEKPVKKSAKVEKPEKKAKKPEKSSTAPAEIGGVWPYRDGSLYLWVFQQMYPKGIKADKLRQIVESKGHSFKFLVGVMKQFNHRHHSWKFTDEDGRLQIYDVKYKPNNPLWDATKPYHG